MVRVFRVLIPGSILVLALGDAVLVGASYAAAMQLVDQELDWYFFLLYESGGARIGLLAGMLLLGFFFSDLYGDPRVPSKTVLLQQFSSIFGAALMMQALLAYINPDWVIPPKAAMVGSAFALSSVFCWRWAFHVAMKNAVGMKRLLFLGLSKPAADVAAYLESHVELGLSPIGYVGGHDADAPMMNAAVSYLGPSEQWVKIVESTYPEGIVIGKQDELQAGWVDDLLELRFGGVQAEDAVTLYEQCFRRVCARKIRPGEFIYGEALRPSGANIRLQSLYSFAISIVILVAALPALVLIAVMLKISGGPVFVKDCRAGLYGEPFTLYRFRTANGGRVGRFLRRFRLDEFPSLLHVLTGHLSIVGPRPVRIVFSERLRALIPFYNHRHVVRPGLIGWADLQVDSASPDAIRMLEYDLYYVKNMAPSLDLLILLHAAKRLFRS